MLCFVYASFDQTKVIYSCLFVVQWVFLNSKTPSGLTAREPFQIRIANEDGSWFGTKSGTVVENPLVFRSRKFPEKGKFTFTVEQGITEETIDEVLDIGLRLTERK